MRIVQINGDESHRWRWFRIPDTDAQVELYAMDVSELDALRRKLAKSEDDASQYLAARAFRDFRGMQDASGAPLENSEAMRLAILRAAPDVRAFVLLKLADFRAWADDDKAAPAVQAGA
jgi:hypothetical protein